MQTPTFALLRSFGIVALFLALPQLASAAISVCVDVQTKSWTEDAPVDSPQDDVAPDPFAIDPARYLKRMVEYEVTHEVGFKAADNTRICDQHLTIELYPLRSGWTVFARYSGHSREEKVDHVQLDEFVALAQRLGTALLRDKAIHDTMTRQTVLRDDSEGRLRTIEGQGHFVFALGTQLRVGSLPTTQGANAAVSDELRYLAPLSLQLGYRGKYQAWGLDVFARGALATNERAPKRNQRGGHVDMEGAASLGIHFLRYTDAQGMSSFYYGGGAQFELSRYSVIRAEGDREFEDRDSILGGGLNADLVLGVEFMRASSVHFFLQAELNIPTYRFDSDVDAGGLDSYLPGGLAQIGIVF